MGEFCFPAWMQHRINALEESNESPVNDISLTFPGKISYYNTLPEIAAVSENLLNYADKREELILGFDLEWPFSYQFGSGKTSLIQICLDKSKCYLFHVNCITVLPRTFILLIRHPKVKLVGLNIRNDLRKLGRDFSLNVDQVLQNNLVELSTYANKKLLTSEKWSLDRLVLHLLKVTLQKPSDVRLSNWSKPQLSQKQIEYAATDAYASLLCFLHLRTVPQKSVDPLKSCEGFSQLLTTSSNHVIP